MNRACSSISTPIIARETCSVSIEPAYAGDEERAQTPLRLTIAVCERARRLNLADEWLRPTLLAAAFDLGEPDKAEELADAVIDQGPAA